MNETKNVPEMIKHEFEEIKTVKLTLNPNEINYDMSFIKDSSQKEDVSKTESGISAGTIEESMLSDKEKENVEEFVKQIDVSNIQTINSYGASAQKGISKFSVSLTSKVKTKEFGNIGDSLKELRIAINSTITPEKKGLLELLKRKKQKITYIIANYESAEANIKKIEKNLYKHQQELIKDVYIFDQMYDMNLEFYKELTMYIIAGKKALGLARNTELAELQKKAELTQNQLDIQNYRDYGDACDRFEKRIFDLETTRLISIQMAPQIRLLQNADQQVVDKLRSDIINTIPLWRNQMVLALGIEHTTNALNAQNAIDKMTNEMLKKNAETLRDGAIKAANASEEGLVDIEILKKINADVVTSINEVVRIHEEGSKKRNEIQKEIVQIEKELKEALLEAASR